MPRSLLLPSLMALVLTLATLVGGPAALAAPSTDNVEGASLDLIFVDRDYLQSPKDLAWQLERTGPESPSFQPVSDGRLVLARVDDAESGETMLELHEAGPGPDGKTHDRVLGRYPANLGDPVLLYFLETVTRNMSELARGNPDYIRNRIKDALRSGSTVTEADDGGHLVILTPFASDPNAARMAGFDQLTLQIDVGPDPHAPIRKMSAEAGTNGYALRLTEVVP